MHNDSAGCSREAYNSERLTLAQIDDRYSGFGKLRIPIEVLMNRLAGNGWNRDYQVSTPNVSFISSLDSSKRNSIVSTLNNMTTSVYFESSNDGKLSMIKSTRTKEDYPIAERLIKSVLTNPKHNVEFRSVDNPYVTDSNHDNSCMGCSVRISEINFLPEKDAKNMQFYSVNGAVTPQFMTDRTMNLAHELIHAQRSMLGVGLNDDDQRRNKIDTPLYYPNGVKRGNIGVSQEEIETTGQGVVFKGSLTNGFRGEFSENILRQERGLPIRTTYASATAKRKKGEIKP